MIYIENNLKKQDVFVPRNDTTICYVSPYDKGYQDGYQDGIEDCGDCPIQQKEVVLTATTETVVPDQGYAGMDSVFVDARQLALEKYNEGYHEGEEDGAEEQKSKLETVTFDRNGEYTREDGWSAVTVAVPKEISLGTLVDAPQMSDITYEYYIKTFDPQEASVDGWGEIRLYMGTLIGQSKDEQKALMTGTTFTQNGLYRREDGWNEVIVEVPQTGTTCNLESKTETVTADTQTILPSSGYDGMSEVVVDATDYGQDKYDEGYADGQASVPPCPPCPEIESGVTYGIGSGFTGATVTPSSGYDGMAEVTITDNGYGQEKYNDGFTDGQTDILSGLTDTTIRQNGSYSNPSGWSGVTVLVQPTLEAASYALPTGFTGTTIVPSSGYDGLSSVVITDGGYGQEKYDEGYQDGLGDCPAPSLEQKSVTLTATTETVTPSQGYDGMDEVSINANDLCLEYYRDGINDGLQNNDFIFIIPSSSVTLTDYGIYAFVYDSGVTIPSMLVNFNYSGGTASTVGGYVEFDTRENKYYNSYELYNISASTATLDKIEIDDVVFTGNTFTGNAAKFKYYFNGDVPDEFFMGWDAPTTHLGPEMRFENINIGRNAFKDCRNLDYWLSQGMIRVFIYGSCTFKTGSFSNAGIGFLLLNGAGNVYFETNSFVNNSSLNRISIGPSITGFNGDSTLFSGSANSGLISNYSSAIPNSFLYNSNWFQSNLLPNGWIIN